MSRIVACVGAIVLDPAGRLLLVKRANPPAQGCWSLPGGRVEPGETDPQAVAREVLEETGLQVHVGRLVGRVERPGPHEVSYQIADYACDPQTDRLRAGDDAADAGWFGLDQVAGLTLSPGLLETLRDWRVLPES